MTVKKHEKGLWKKEKVTKKCSVKRVVKLQRNSCALCLFKDEFKRDT